MDNLKFRKRAPGTETERMSFVRRADLFIDEHLCEKISLQMLCDTCYLSMYHYVREFKKEAGVTPKQYVIRRKLKAAEHLLRHSDLKVYEVAERIGYEPSQFVTLFRKNCGMPPAQFRERVLNEVS